MNLIADLERRMDGCVVMAVGVEEMQAVLARLRSAEDERGRLARLLVEYTTFPPCAKGSEFVDKCPFDFDPRTCERDGVERLGECWLEWVHQDRKCEVWHG